LCVVVPLGAGLVELPDFSVVPEPVWVISVNESGVIIIITGCPSLFVARIKKDSGTTLISVKPACFEVALHLLLCHRMPIIL